MYHQLPFTGLTWKLILDATGHDTLPCINDENLVTSGSIPLKANRVLADVKFTSVSSLPRFPSNKWWYFDLILLQRPAKIFADHLRGGAFYLCFLADLNFVLIPSQLIKFAWKWNTINDAQKSPPIVWETTKEDIVMNHLEGAMAQFRSGLVLGWNYRFIGVVFWYGCGLKMVMI